MHLVGYRCRRPSAVNPPRLSILLVCLAGCSCADVPPSLAGTCSADLERIATIEGDYAGRAGIGLVAQDYVLTVNNSDRASVHVFDRNGRYLRTFGGAGEGPGEFQSISDVRQLPDGRIVVFDQRALRVTYFTPAMSLEETHPLPVSLWPHGAQWDGEDGWYLTGRMVDRDHFGSPVVHINENGSVLRYFGENETETEGPLAGMMVNRAVALHPDHGLFTLKGNQYVVEHWTPDGSLGRTIEPDVDWFHWPPPWMEDGPTETAGRAVGDREPENAFLDMQFGERGHLWTLSQVTPPNWRDGLSDGRIIDYAAWTDNVVHVLDITRGREICTVRLEDIFVFGGFAGPGILKTYEEGSLGRPTVTFWRLTIQP